MTIFHAASIASVIFSYDSKSDSFNSIRAFLLGEDGHGGQLPAGGHVAAGVDVVAGVGEAAVKYK